MTHTARRPEKLDEKEWQYEQQERTDRRKNIVMRGIRTYGKGMRHEVKSSVIDKLGLPIYIDRMKPSSGGMLLELESF